MPDQSPSTCPHDLGPGITVCLRCRSAARQTTRARQQRLMGAAAVVVVVAGVIGSAAVGAAHGTRRAPDAAASTVAQQGEVMAPAPLAAAATPPAAAPASPVGRPVRRLPSLVIAEGRASLRDGLSVERTGDQAVVSFDTPATRTRRRDKVEQVVRATLPVLYGPEAAAALDRIPEGTLSQGDLLTEVVPAGIRVPLASGAIALSLETRPGQDGPLVVRYRARVVR